MKLAKERWREPCSRVHLFLFWCVVSKESFQFSLSLAPPLLPCPFSLLFFSCLSHPWTLSLYSLDWAEARGLEILNSFHWNSFSTQNQFLVFILWWFLLCCNIIIKPFHSKINGFSPPFAFEISSTSTPINHWFKGGKKNVAHRTTWDLPSSPHQPICISC